MKLQGTPPASDHISRLVARSCNQHILEERVATARRTLTEAGRTA